VDNKIFSDEDLTPKGDGQLPSDIKIPNKAKWIAIIGYLLPGLAFLFMTICLAFENFMDNIPGIILFGGFSILSLWIAYSYIKRELAIKKQ
jgi:hypothetical protein